MASAPVLGDVIEDADSSPNEVMLAHKESFDLMSPSIKLSATKMMLVTTMSHEYTMRSRLGLIRHDHGYIICFWTTRSCHVSFSSI